MRRIIVVADDPIVLTEAEQAILATGIALSARRTGWREAPAVLADTHEPAAIFADARGVDGATVAAILPELVYAGRGRIVVAFDIAQIDDVSGPLLTTDAMLLCEATEAERATAIALAVADDGLRVHDSSCEADRLRQLNAEVARFAETLARLTRAVAPDTQQTSQRSDPFVAERGPGFGAEPPAVDASEIRRAIRARRMRDDAFGTSGLFEDPAWDMLLDLFAAELEQRRVSVSSLCIAAAVAPTTALRWIGKLIGAGLLERRPDDLDRRRAFLSLTARASTAMRNYVSALRRAGLAIV